MALQLVDFLLYEREPQTGILWIKFNRPERLNALLGLDGPEGNLQRLVEYLRAGDADPDVRVIVVTGVGRAFCAGVDVSGRPPEGSQAFLPRRPDEVRQHFYHQLTPLFYEIARIRK